MGLSSSKTTQSQTSTSGPSAQALPFINAGSTALQSAYDQTQPIASNIGTTLGNMFSGYTPTDTSGLTAAKAANDSLLTGGGANPELDNIIRTSNNSVADKINALFSKAGQTGSSRQIGELGARLSENESNLRYQDYNTQQSRIQQAIANAMGLTSADTAAKSGDISNLINLGSSAVSIPSQPANNLASGLGGLWGNATTSTGTGTTTNDPSTASQIGSGLKIASSLASLFSDRRLKMDIEKTGELDDGLPTYSYSYIWEPHVRRVGVMADEVGQYRPWALGPVINGFSTVDYNHIPEVR